VQTTEKQEEKKTPEYGKIVLLKDRGPSLPLGTMDPTTGGWVRSMAHHTWKFAHEKKLALLREKDPKANLAQYVSTILATMFTQLGAHDLGAIDDKKLHERRALVSSMFMGDVFYAYVWLRIAALGHELQMQLTCPHCRESYPFVADLNTLSVRCFEKIEDARWTYTLHDPFTTRGGLVTGLVLGPPRWNVLEKAPAGSMDLGLVKQLLVQGSVQGIVANGETRTDIALSSVELDEMTKWDIEALANGIGAHNLGPLMAIEDRCTNERCEREVRVPIDWGYDGFFAASSS
jgi:hypothetical protein